MLTQTACGACGGPLHPSEWLSPLPFADCLACGFSQRQDRGGEEVREHYATDAYGRDRAPDYTGEGFDDRRRDARVRVRFLRSHLPAGTVLDVGTAGGAFLLEAVHAGYAGRGLEPVPSFARYARERLGLDVVTGTLEDADLPDRALDAVTLWHVLEHLEAPAPSLERIRSALRPGGIVALEVPNAGSAVARALGREWPMLEPAVHVGQYTPAALRALLERTGFAVRELGAVSSTSYLPRTRQLRPRALVHRLRWGRRDGDLLRAVAAS